MVVLIIVVVFAGLFAIGCCAYWLRGSLFVGLLYCLYCVLVCVVLRRFNSVAVFCFLMFFKLLFVIISIALCVLLVC